MITCYNVPGLRNSPADHWQTLWEQAFPDQIHRVEQSNWDAPDKNAWVKRVEETLSHPSLDKTILIGHSVGCATIAHWFLQYQRPIKGALLVAPSDVEAPSYPSYITGFSPLPLDQLPFLTIVVASSNDRVVDPERARYFAKQWGGQFILLPKAGHIEGSSGFGAWPQGIELLHELGF